MRNNSAHRLALAEKEKTALGSVNNAQEIIAQPDSLKNA